MEQFKNLTEINWVLWIAGLFALLEFGKWAWSLIEYYLAKFDIETKNMKQKKAFDTRLTTSENNIKEIKGTVENNANKFEEHERLILENVNNIKDELIHRLSILDSKFDDHKHQLEKRLEVIDSDGKARDCTVLRDRILSGLRYFSQNKDDMGNVHISMTDFENMSKMFDEYEKAGGNGLVKHMKETEFEKFIVDTEKKL